MLKAKLQQQRKWNKLLGTVKHLPTPETGRISDMPFN
jgi:hypothetical protein